MNYKDHSRLLPPGYLLGFADILQVIGSGRWQQPRALSQKVGTGQYGVGKAVAPRRYMWLILKKMHNCIPVPYIPFSEKDFL